MYIQKTYFIVFLAAVVTSGINNLALADNAIVTFSGIIQAPACTLENGPQSLQVPLTTTAPAAIYLDMNCTLVGNEMVSVTSDAVTQSSNISRIFLSREADIAIDTPIQERHQLKKATNFTRLVSGKNKINVISIYQDIMKKNENREIPLYASGQVTFNYQ